MNNFIIPNWPAPGNVKAVTTTRTSGFSMHPYDSFNLALHTGDEPNSVLKNRSKLTKELNLKNEPFWLTQEHTDIAIQIENNTLPTPVIADAAFTSSARQIPVIMTADCVPILVCDKDGTIVAAIHAGWKGIANGVIQSTIKAMDTDPSQLLAWLGPAIGPNAFEVNQEIYDIFSEQLSVNSLAFTKNDNNFLANIYTLAANALKNAKVSNIYGGQYCTFTQKDLFYSYRRDGKKTGRMASMIWLEISQT